VVVRDVLHILGALEDADLEWLVAAGELRRVRAGEALILEQRGPDTLFVVLEGELVVSRAGLPLTRLGVGEVVGEMSLLDERPPSATVHADDDSEVLAVPYGPLRAKLAADPAFSSRFHHALCTFLANRLGRADALLVPLGWAPRAATERAPPQLATRTLEALGLAAARFDWFRRRVRSGPRGHDGGTR